MKKWYHELNLKQVFKEYEEESYKNIVELISGNLPQELFLEFVKKIFKRYKWVVWSKLGLVLLHFLKTRAVN